MMEGIISLSSQPQILTLVLGEEKASIQQRSRHFSSEKSYSSTSSGSFACALGQPISHDLDYASTYQA
jgi:hypothetical protein